MLYQPGSSFARRAHTSPGR